jgi:GNAT superfamily N-acetyltransferase
MVLAEPPAAVEGVEVRAVATFEEYAPVRELGWDLLGMSEGERAEPRARLQATWDDYQDIDISNFAAFVDGRVVAAGGVQFTPYGAYLAGGSTHPDYRGHGYYRALVVRDGMLRRHGERRCSPSKLERCRSQSSNASASSRLQPCARSSIVRDGDALGDDQREAGSTNRYPAASMPSTVCFK